MGRNCIQTCAASPVTRRSRIEHLWTKTWMLGHCCGAISIPICDLNEKRPFNLFFNLWSFCIVKPTVTRQVSIKNVMVILIVWVFIRICTTCRIDVLLCLLRLVLLGYHLVRIFIFATIDECLISPGALRIKYLLTLQMSVHVFSSAVATMKNMSMSLWDVIGYFVVKARPRTR
jgi:hypothetical protein